MSEKKIVVGVEEFHEIIKGWAGRQGLKVLSIGKVFGVNEFEVNVEPLPVEPKEYPVCEKCGSEDVTLDTIGKWDMTEQIWKTVGALDNSDCNNCGEEVNLIWKRKEQEEQSGN
jgi:hypothetical protein